MDITYAGIFLTLLGIVYMVLLVILPFVVLAINGKLRQLQQSLDAQHKRHDAQQDLTNEILDRLDTRAAQANEWSKLNADALHTFASRY